MNILADLPSNDTILIVDDVPDNVQLLDLMLSAQGYEVRSATSGEMALNVISELKPALILLDIMMPGMDGFEVCEKLKNDQQFCEIPIIYISSLEDVENKLKAFTCGGVDYITKPFQSEEVLARVATHIKLHQAKEQAERARAFLAEAQGIAHLGSWEWNIVTGKQVWSAEMFRIYGYEPDSFSPDYDVYSAAVHPQDKDKVFAAVEKIMTNSMAPYNLEYRILRPDGSERIVHVQGVIYYDGSDQPARMIGTVHDITERSRMQNALMHHEKMLSVGSLAAGMAHEINNPLAGITQGIQNIHRRLSADNEKNREVADELGLDLNKVWEYFVRREISSFLQGMAKSSERAAEIVNSILSFARVPQMKKLQDEDLSILIERTIELAKIDYDLNCDYGFNAIQIIRDYCPSLDPIPCKALEIEQVLLMLLKNAAQAFKDAEMPDRTPTITIRIVKAEETVCIEIEDNGPGIDKKVLPKIFEPFFTTRTVGKDAGLGLSVSYFIITHEHSGSITAESQAGKGSQFKICLPMKINKSS